MTELENYDHCYEVSQAKYALYWTLDGEYINLALVATTTGFIGFGVSKTVGSGMLNSDVTIAYVAAGSATANDYFIVGSQPSDRMLCDEGTGVCLDTVLGGTNDVSDVSGTEEDGVTTVRFRRPKSNAAIDDYDVDFKDVPWEYIWSMSLTDTLGFHGGGQGKLPNFNFEDPGMCDDEDCMGYCVKGCCVVNATETPTTGSSTSTSFMTSSTNTEESETDDAQSSASKVFAFSFLKDLLIGSYNVIRVIVMGWHEW